MPHLNTRIDANPPANGGAGSAMLIDAPPPRLTTPCAGERRTGVPAGRCLESRRHETPRHAAPLPLRRAVPPAAPFPIDALGPELAAAARAIQTRTQAPLALCGQAVLGAVAVAAQAHADVLLPDGRQRPLSLALLSVASCGERLDAVESWALRAIRAHERQLHAEYGVQRQMFRTEHAAWRGACGGPDRGRAAIRERIEAAGPEPQAPYTRAVLASAPTLEGMLTMLAGGQPNMGWFGDEPVTVAAGRGGSAVRRRLARVLSGLWDDGTADRRHARDGRLKLYGKRLSVHVATPPGEALVWLTSADPADERLRARLLCVMPDSTIGTRLLDDDMSMQMAATAPSLGRFDAAMRELLLTEPRVVELEPPALPLAKEAARLWRQFNNAVEADMRDGGPLAGLRPLGSLAAEHVARIAGVLCIYADRQAREIAAEAVAAAIELVRHYLGEAVRIAGVAGESEALRRAQAVLDHVTGLGRPVVHLADIYQYGPASVRDAASARAALRLLADHGHVAAIEGGAAVDGRHHREAWQVVADAPAAPAADGATAPDEAEAADPANAAKVDAAAKAANPAKAAAGRIDPGSAGVPPASAQPRRPLPGDTSGAGDHALTAAPRAAAGKMPALPGDRVRSNATRADSANPANPAHYADPERPRPAGADTAAVNQDEQSQSLHGERVEP